MYVTVGDVDAITKEILGAAFEVSRVLGHGFLEKVYQRALLVEMARRNLSAASEVSFTVGYKGAVVGTYVADLIVADRVIVEIKALDALAPAHVGQVLNYLRAAELPVGLLLNFGRPKLEYRRVLH